MDTLSKVNIIVFVDNNIIDFYNKRGDKLASLKIPDQLFSLNQISNVQSYNQLLSDFIQQLVVKDQTVLILLSHNLSLKKILDRKDEDKELDPESEFKDLEIPKSKQIIKKLKTKDQLHVFVASQNLVYPLCQGFYNQSWQVIAVLPFSIYSKSTKHEDHISSKTIEVILKDTELIEMGNLVEPKKLSLQPDIKIKHTKYYSSVWFAIIMILIMGGIIGYLFYIVTYPPNSDQNLTPQISNVVPTPVTDQTSNLTPTSAPSSAVTQSNLKVKILNGSGVAGQAGQVRDQVKLLGYTNIEVGNASDYDSPTTMIVFSNKVADKYQTDLINKLKQTFSKIDSKIDPTATTDITITTGTD